MGDDYDWGGDQGDLGDLFSRLQQSKAKELSLEIENNELRRSLRKSTSDVALSREYELLCMDRLRMQKLVEQLRLEKEHLISSVVALSNEVDEAHRLHFDDNLKYKQEMLRHAEDDKIGRRHKYQMGLGIIDILRAASVDALIVQEVQMHITNASFSAATKPTDGKQQQRVPFGTNSGGYSEGGGGEDARTAARGLLVGAGAGAGAGADGLNDDTGEGSLYTPSSSIAGSPLRASRSRNRRSKDSRHRNRNRDYLERDEEGSDISSVSTHRSGKSREAELAAAENRRRNKLSGSARRAAKLNAANAQISREAARSSSSRAQQNQGGAAASGGCMQS